MDCTKVFVLTRFKLKKNLSHYLDNANPEASRNDIERISKAGRTKTLLFTSKNDPKIVTFLSEWKNRSDYDKYVSSELFKGLLIKYEIDDVPTDLYFLQEMYSWKNPDLHGEITKSGFYIVRAYLDNFDKFYDDFLENFHEEFLKMLNIQNLFIYLNEENERIVTLVLRVNNLDLKETKAAIDKKLKMMLQINYFDIFDLILNSNWKFDL